MIIPYGRIGSTLESFPCPRLALGANIAWRELLRLLNGST